MKRFLVLLLVAVMAVPALFADVTVGGWGRIITEVQGNDIDGSDILAEMGPNWGAGGGRVRFTVAGSSDQIGFNFDVDGNVGTNWGESELGVAEQLRIWIKPIDMVKISVGQFDVASLRGKFGGQQAAGGFGANDDLTANSVGGHALWVYGGDFEDAIFARSRYSHGFAAEITPVEGLTINAGFNFETAADPTDTDNPAGTVVATLKTAQVQLGYNIEGIGLARVQYVGYNPDDGAHLSEDVQVAFNLTAVEGLNVDLGAIIDVSEAKDDLMVALGVSYQVMDALKLTLLFNTQFSDPLPIYVALKTSYSLGAISLNLDVDMLTVDGGGTLMTIYPYARMGLGNGYASAGFKLCPFLPESGDGVTFWSIPVVYEYWF